MDFFSFYIQVDGHISGPVVEQVGGQVGRQEKKNAGRWAGRRTCTVGVKVDETVPVGQLGGQTERIR